MKLNLSTIAVFVLLSHFSSFAQTRRVVVIGSSTAAGVGPSSPDSAWVNRFNQYYTHQLGVVDTVYNLAVSGTTPYNATPTNYTPPAGRPSPDVNKNVTKAVSLLSGLANPSNGVILVNFPTNGFDVYTIPEIMSSLQIIYDSATRLGNRCYISTTQPRSDGGFATSAVKAKLNAIKDSIINRFGGSHTLDFWTGMYTPADTTILAAYSAGDNIHLNNAGHRILYQRVVDKNILGLVQAGDYRSNIPNTALWSGVSSWQRYDGSNWVAAIASPTSADGVITIQAGDTINISAAVTIDQVVVESTAGLGVFSTGGPAFTCTLNNGTGNDIEVNGRLLLSVNGTLAGAGTVQINNGGFYILRNNGKQQVNTTNYGTMNVSGTGFIENASLTNNHIFELVNFTLLLNSNASFINNDSVSITTALVTDTLYFASTIGTGTFTNSATGVINKPNANGVFRVNATVAFTNLGKIKGQGGYSFVNTVSNTGTISPGNNNAGIITVNPSFITGTTPVANLDIISTGAVAGTNYDQLGFTTINFLNTNVTGVTVNITDNASDPVGTVYTIATSSGTVTGPFQAVNKPSHFANPVYNSNTITIQKTGLARSWDAGAGTTNWNDAANWNPDGVPAVQDNISIPSGTAFAPSLTAGSTSAVALTVASGATLTIGTGNSLSVSGTVTNNGTIAGAGKLVLNGSSAQYIYGSGTMNNLELANSTGANIVSGNAINLTGALTPTLGTLTTNNGLVLKSTATGTAYVDQGSGSYISGNVTVERYISTPLVGNNTGRAWRLLTAPVTGSSNNSVYYNWQNNGANNGKGMEIWGPVPGNGLVAGYSYSMKTYNNTSNAYVSANNTMSQNLFDATGNIPFMAFVSGPYASGYVASGYAPTTLKATGGLSMGTKNISFTPTATNKFQLVANPYACAVDFDAVYNSSTNLEQEFYTLDPNLGSVGAYVHVKWFNGLGYVVTPSSGTSQGLFIQSGQAFFAKATLQAATTVSFTEATKSASATNNSVNVFRTNAGEFETMHINMRGIAAGNIPYAIDGTVVNCHQSFQTSYLPAEDGLKFMNFNESIYILEDNKNMDVDGRPLFDNGDSLHIALAGMSQHGYQLQILPSNINASAITAKLYDSWLDTLYPVNLSAENIILFTVTSNPASSSPHRFTMTFHNATPLPLLFVNVQATKKTTGAELSWQVADQTGIEKYIVEKSTDGKTFRDMAVQNASNKNGYSQADDALKNGNNYYRIKAVDKDSKQFYSPVAKLNNSLLASISVYPNPVTNDNTAHLQANNLQTGIYSIAVYNTIGQLVIQKNINHEGGSANIELNMKQAARGVYQLKMTDNSGQVLYNQKLIIE